MQDISKLVQSVPGPDNNGAECKCWKSIARKGGWHVSLTPDALSSASGGMELKAGADSINEFNLILSRKQVRPNREQKGR